MLRAVYIFLAAGLLIHSTAPGQGVSVLPAPQILTINGAPVALHREDQVVSVQYGPAALAGSRPVALGVELLASRLELLGASLVTESAPPDASVVAVVQESNRDLLDVLRALGLAEELDEDRLAQAYVLSCSREPGKPLITLSACSPLGAYYGLLALCQLLDTDEGGHVSMPCVQIADWPGIGLRLAKTSASENPLRTVRAFAAWNGLMKMNMLGLQYHGKASMAPEQVFMHNVEALCGEARRDQLMKTIVYFCPFRGGDKACDFRRAEDRAQYVTLMRQFLAQDAHGVEVDYNDWPDKTSGIAIADVINLVCSGIAPGHPNAYVVYCPPIDEYWGMAKPSLSETLSNVPANVLTLWTGMGTLINTLRREDVEEWTKLTGRRPFLWVNRVFIRGQFSRELNKGQGDYVFRGEALPRDLNGLFEGVHFNAGLSTGYNRL
ncbi:MAG: hypothetical protein HOH74_24650, partial [Gemmatimonadetes bacterium]|nr:hypothetical protein [Gemmatimonadota bacterium]